MFKIYTSLYFFFQPETSEYRNKNEFTVGYGLDSKSKILFS